MPSLLSYQVCCPAGKAGQFLLQPCPARRLPARCHHGQRQGAERGRLAGGVGEHESFPHGDAPLAGRQSDRAGRSRELGGNFAGYVSVELASGTQGGRQAADAKYAGLPLASPDEEFPPAIWPAVYATAASLIFVAGIDEHHPRDGAGVPHGELPGNYPAGRVAHQDVRLRNPGSSQQDMKLARHVAVRAPATRRRVAPPNPGPVVQAYPHFAGEFALNADPREDVVGHRGHDDNGRRS